MSSYCCEHNSSLWKCTLRRILEQIDSKKGQTSFSGCVVAPYWIHWKTSHIQALSMDGCAGCKGQPSWERVKTSLHDESNVCYCRCSLQVDDDLWDLAHVGKHSDLITLYMFKKSAGGNLRWALCFLEINLVNFHLTINELIHIYNNP